MVDSGYRLTVNTIRQGVFNKSVSLYFLPIQGELGISRAAYSLAESLARLEGGIQGPLVGYLTDRLGYRIMMVAGGAISGVGLILLSFTHSYLYFLLVFVGLLSVGFRTGYDNAVIPAVNQWFRRKRGLAISIVSISPGLGGMVITPIMGLLVVGLGWRFTVLASGVVVLAVVIPLSLLARRSPESMGLLPDGVPAETPHATLNTGLRQDEKVDAGAPGSSPGKRTMRQTSVDTDFTTKEAMGTPSYWLLILAQGVRNAVQSGMQWHLIPLMVWSGISATTAAFFVGLMSFSTLILNPLAGWMGDRWSKQRICAVAMVLGGLGMLVLMSSSGHLWELAIFVVLLAVSETNTPLNWAILGEFFGRKNYATLHGWIQLPNQLMAMSTPVSVGWIFDRTDSYFWALVPLTIMMGVSALLYWTLPEPKIPTRTSDNYGVRGR